MTPGFSVRVAFPPPLPDRLDYGIPETLIEKVRPGARVEAPLGNRYVVGVALSVVECEDPQKLRPLTAVLDDSPALPEDLLDLLSWLSRYYRASFGEALRAALPPGGLSAERLHIALDSLGRSLLDGLPLPALAHLSSRERNRLLRLLSALPRTGETPLRTAFRNANRVDRETLRDWEARGFLRLRDREPPGARRLRVARLYPAVSAEDAREALSRSPRQEELFRLVLDAPGKRRAALAEKDPNRARAVRELLKKGLLRVEEETVRRSPLSDHRLACERTKEPPKLRPGQERALGPLREAIRDGRNETFLLYGPPGSGKTEVYLHAAEEALAKGGNVLFIVPEIALTPQFAGRVSSRFGDEVALWHSGLSAGERYDEWRRMRRGQARLVVGARMAALAPLGRLGLIVVDEEQDGSYKSEDRPRYQARDVAVMRGKLCGCPVLLGSATPSVESVANVRLGRYTELTLPRPDRLKPPHVRLIDMKKPRPSTRSLLGSELVLAMEKRLERREQTILFLNRRGFAPYLLCRACRQPVECPGCSLTLTYHRTTGRMLCHACGARHPYPERCPACGADDLHLVGVGTQRLEDELDLTFPEARIARLDRDAVTGKGKLSELLDNFSSGLHDILVGTQMVTKGHDFPNVTLVGVLDADQSLHIPDFRSAERTFQLLTQVAGRAGRREIAGEVLIQTYQPDHYVLQAVQAHDPEAFYRRELRQRRGLYPPHRRLCLVRLEGPDEDRTLAAAGEIALQLSGIPRTSHPGVSILGPSRPLVFRLRNRFRALVLVKAETAARLQRFLDEAERRKIFESGSDVRVSLDVDPFSMV